MNNLHDCDAGEVDCCENNADICKLLCDDWYPPKKNKDCSDNKGCKQRCDNTLTKCIAGGMPAYGWKNAVSPHDYPMP